MSYPRTGYDDIVVAAPVTVLYVRHSIRGAHWFLAGALAELMRRAGLRKEHVDGLCVSSFTLAPDTAVGLTQHLGLTLRWLDHIPMGGACGIVALRRAARAVQSGDASVVACLAGDTNHVDSFRQTIASFSQFARDAVYPYGSGGPNASFAFLTDYHMRTRGTRREDFGKVCVAQRANALRYPHALFRKPLSLEEYLAARPIAEPRRSAREPRHGGHNDAVSMTAGDEVTQPVLHEDSVIGPRIVGIQRRERQKPDRFHGLVGF